MDDAQIFLVAVRQAGYGQAAALAVLAWVVECLGGASLIPTRFYIFRSDRKGGGNAAPPTRPRVLVAFRSADAALSFAQKAGIGAAPRLAAMSLGQLLTALIQRPTIGTLLIATEIEEPIQAGLPIGTRIERAALFDQLQIADCRL